MRLQHGWPGFAYGLHMSVTRFRWHSITCSVGFGSRFKFGDSCGTLPMESPHRLLLGDVTQPANGSKSHLHGAYGNEANFDTNMVIILAALLCALICALGLNSIVRCALRCGRRMVFETPEQAAARLATTGLKKRALRQIPVTVYKSETSIPATECPICLGEFMEGEKVRVLPKCNHGFHMKCIDTWLMSHSSCPTCRHSLLERPVPDSADLEAGIQSIGTGSDHRATVVGIPDEAN